MDSEDIPVEWCEPLDDIERARGVGKRRVIVDMGCGKGGRLARHRGKNPDDVLIGVDSNKEKIREAREEYDHLGIHFIVGDATRTSIKPNSVDQVWIKYPNPVPDSDDSRSGSRDSDTPIREFLGGARDMLKPGGLISITTEVTNIMRRAKRFTDSHDDMECGYLDGEFLLRKKAPGREKLDISRSPKPVQRGSMRVGPDGGLMYRYNGD